MVVNLGIFLQMSYALSVNLIWKCYNKASYDLPLKFLSFIIFFFWWRAPILSEKLSWPLWDPGMSLIKLSLDRLPDARHWAAHLTVYVLTNTLLPSSPAARSLRRESGETALAVYVWWLQALNILRVSCLPSWELLDFHKKNFFSGNFHPWKPSSIHRLSHLRPKRRQDHLAHLIWALLWFERVCATTNSSLVFIELFIRIDINIHFRHPCE